VALADVGGRGARSVDQLRPRAEILDDWSPPGAVCPCLGARALFSLADDDAVGSDACGTAGVGSVGCHPDEGGSIQPP
jgi:hypothetical protein